MLLETCSALIGKKNKHIPQGRFAHRSLLCISYFRKSNNESQKFSSRKKVFSRIALITYAYESYFAVGSYNLHLSYLILSNTFLRRMLLRAALAKSGPLDFPSEKSFLLFFAHEKGLGHMFQKQFSCSPILFFCVATSQK